MFPSEAPLAATKDCVQSPLHWGQAHSGQCPGLGAFLIMTPSRSFPEQCCLSSQQLSQSFRSRVSLRVTPNPRTPLKVTFPAFSAHVTTLWPSLEQGQGQEWRSGEVRSSGCGGPPTLPTQIPTLPTQKAKTAGMEGRSKPQTQTIRPSGMRQGAAFIYLDNRNHTQHRPCPYPGRDCAGTGQA